MKCPKCQSEDFKVLESRVNKAENSIRRRRECSSCKFRFTTYEKIESKIVRVLKKNGKTQALDINKIERGLNYATDKLKVTTSQMEEAIRNIEEAIYSSVEKNNTIKSDAIASITMAELAKISEVAYVRFAAVYKAFNTLDEFIKEIESLKN